MTEGPAVGELELEADIGHWLQHHAFFQPDKPAIVFEGGAPLTYAALHEQTDAAASLLSRRFGIHHGDRIAFLGFNHPSMLVLLFACARLGAILVPLNWRLTAPELSYIVSNCSPKALFHDDEHTELAGTINGREASLSRQPVSILVAGSGGQDYEAGGALDDSLLIVYTSGTTGRPKGAVLSQRALLVNALNSIDMHGLSKDDTVLVVLPLFHVGGLNIQLVPAIYAGATVHLHSRFEPKATLAAIENTHPDLLVLVPATMQAIMAQREFETTDFSSLRMLSTGSTVVPVELIAAFEAKDISVVQVYGSTETCPIATYQRPGDGRTKPSSSGHAALFSAFRIIDENGAEMSKPEQEGEICVRGEHVMSAYWLEPEASASALQDGWFRTGDIGVRGHDGELYFRDRKSHVIISGGENVYPAEVERVLRGIDGIEDAGVVGLPDAQWGEVPAAALVCDGTPPEETAIRAQMAVELARFKHPKHLIVVDALPRNAMGKVVAGDLRTLLEARIGARQEG